MTDNKTIAQRVAERRAVEVARKLGGATILLSIAYFVIVTGAFLLMIIMDPPMDGMEVSRFQIGCTIAMFVGYVPGCLAIILGVVGVIRKTSRRLMWLPLIVTIVVFFLPGLVSLTWWAVYLRK